MRGPAFRNGRIISRLTLEFVGLVTHAVGHMTAAADGDELTPSAVVRVAGDSDTINGTLIKWRTRPAVSL